MSETTSATRRDAANSRPAGPPPRELTRRITDTLETLRTQRHLWLATAKGDLPHLVPLAYVWDGTELLCATKKANRSVRNLHDSGRAKVAVGTAQDVVLIEAAVTTSDPRDAPAALAATFDRLPLNPMRVPGVLLLHLRPVTISVWRELSEMADRVIMAGGSWLNEE